MISLSRCGLETNGLQSVGRRQTRRDRRMVVGGIKTGSLFPAEGTGGKEEKHGVLRETRM